MQSGLLIILPSSFFIPLCFLFIGFLSFYYYLFLIAGMEVTVAGSSKRGYLDGERENAEFDNLVGQIIAVDPHSGLIYITDWYNHVIRVIDPQGMRRIERMGKA
jgi:hypothetical protein